MSFSILLDGRRRGCSMAPQYGGLAFKALERENIYVAYRTNIPELLENPNR